MLLRELKDPRLSGIVSISAVDVTSDYSIATLFITVLGESVAVESTDERKQDVLKAFQSAKGRIRKEIGSQMKLRHVPELQFKIDASQEYGRHIEKLIAGLGLEKDEEEEQDEKL